MTSTLRAAAESHFAAITGRNKVAISETEADLRVTQEKTARLRALRLAHEANTVDIRLKQPR